MPIEVELVESDSVVPRLAEVIIVGGGIIGVSTTYFIAERGVRVVLCEKGVIAGEQSSRNLDAARWVGIHAKSHS